MVEFAIKAGKCLFAFVGAGAEDSLAGFVLHNCVLEELGDELGGVSGHWVVRLEAPEAAKLLFDLGFYFRRLCERIVQFSAMCRFCRLEFVVAVVWGILGSGFGERRKLKWSKS